MSKSLFLNDLHGTKPRSLTVSGQTAAAGWWWWRFDDDDSHLTLPTFLNDAHSYITSGIGGLSSCSAAHPTSSTLRCRMSAAALNNVLKILNGKWRSQLAILAKKKLSCVNGSSWITGSFTESKAQLSWISGQKCIIHGVGLQPQ